jgi:hypothetical protein
MVGDHRGTHPTGFHARGVNRRGTQGKRTREFRFNILEMRQVYCQLQRAVDALTEYAMGKISNLSKPERIRIADARGVYGTHWSGSMGSAVQSWS